MTPLPAKAASVRLRTNGESWEGRASVLSLGEMAHPHDHVQALVLIAITCDCEAQAEALLQALRAEAGP